MEDSNRNAATPGNTGSKKSTIIIGRQPVIEAMENGRAIDKILFQQNVSGDSIGRIRKLAQEKNIPIQQVPVEKLNSFSRSNHQGCIALAAIVEYMNLQQVIDQVVSSGDVPLFVMLDGVTDVRNIGGIARTAICCGAQALIVPDKGIAALNEDAMKASAGALEKINICRVGSLLKAVDELHMNGIQVYTSDMKAPAKLFDIDFKQPCCVILGNEEKGVQPFLNKAADAQFNIPMKGNFDSFNVSVATGIILFEALKQRL
jgi:23S rRNA (guanosine2251-2'-O)-methyltransferase